MVVVSTIKKIRFVVLGLFDNLVDQLSSNIYDIKIFGCSVCFNSVIV